MDDDVQRVSLLLRRAADEMLVFAPPAIDALTVPVRRGARRQRRLAIAMSTAAVLALVVGLPVTVAHHRSSDRTSAPDGSTSPGPSAQAVPVSALQRYRWKPLPKAPIPPRRSAASVWTGNELLVWGGQTSDTGYRSDGAAYDPVKRVWTVLPSAPLSARADALSAWVGGSFVVWGGSVDSSGRQATDGARYDPAAGRWSRLPDAPVASYSWASLVVADGKAVLLSRSADGGRTVHAVAFDPAADAWTRLRDVSIPAGEEFVTAAALSMGHTVMLWLGWEHRTQISKNDVSVEFTIVPGDGTYLLDLTADVWSRSSLGPGRDRSASSALWTGDQILMPDQDIFCGVCSHPMSLVNPGVAIDPRTGDRSPIPSSPLSSSGSAYRWTGSALLVLNVSTEAGGDAKTAMRPGDTAAWNPATNQWSRLSGAAFDGSGAATAWTGDRLLVWGITASDGGRRPPPGDGMEFAPPK